MKKTREDVTREILDVDFDDTTKAKVFDDDGYEDGKSKDREMTANASVSDNFKGGLLYKGKAKDYPGASKILEKKKAKIIQLKPKKNK